MQPSEIKDLNVAIVGGGYAGATAAIALSQLGANVNVYEQAKSIGEVGAGIGLRPPIVQAFRDLGIFDEIAAVSSPSDYLEILTANGDLIVREEWPGIHEFEQENKTRFIHRADFIQAITDLIPGDRLHLNKQMDTIVDNGDSATVTFTDGTSVTADLVIGADGIRSKVRNQILGHAEPVFCGLMAIRAVVDGDAHGLMDDDNLHLWVGENGSMVYFLPLRHRNQVSFDITAPLAEPIANPELTHEEIIALVDGFDERLQATTRDLDMATVNIRGGFDIEKQPQWHTDSVVLIGDAAHAMLWHQGQGANSAVLDAKALADHIAAADSVPEALAAYQAERKPITDVLQDLSRKAPDMNTNDAFPETETFEKGAGVK